MSLIWFVIVSPRFLDSIIWFHQVWVWNKLFDTYTHFSSDIKFTKFMSIYNYSTYTSHHFALPIIVIFNDLWLMCLSKWSNAAENHIRRRFSAGQDPGYDSLAVWQSAMRQREVAFLYGSFWPQQEWFHKWASILTSVSMASSTMLAWTIRITAGLSSCDHLPNASQKAGVLTVF